MKVKRYIGIKNHIKVRKCENLIFKYKSKIKNQFYKTGRKKYKSYNTAMNPYTEYNEE